ncbi:hypothetical protein PV08_10611 [Exophiala spinifera]|uniref:Calcium uniporter protein n=1 Tax=Exophiala spinifera TaxID=91928 RepID=A0A0D1Y8I7_9EURO|nr:uncharacterized protein PV08_10611 [Exophiala spinifera]KIW11311.1 hypothetical protein PV08_10611 [Exophiala spinifera]
MVVLTTTPRILAVLSTLPASTLSSLGLDPVPATPGAPIEHTILLAISKATQSSLNSLLRGTKVYTPPPPPKPEHSPEYVALMARLRKEEERREYAQLVSRKPGDIYLDTDDEDDISPSLVFNILLSIVMCAGTMFYLTRWWTNDGLRVLVSLGAAVLVGVAEVTVYAGYLRKVRQSKDKERSKREKKEFIGEYTGEGAEPDGHMESVDKLEIWGRGINGGMRRRVREKWDKEQESET